MGKQSNRTLPRTLSSKTQQRGTNGEGSNFQVAGLSKKFIKEIKKPDEFKRGTKNS